MHQAQARHDVYGSVLCTDYMYLLRIIIIIITYPMYGPRSSRNMYIHYYEHGLRLRDGPRRLDGKAFF